jgi:hypothetical protein
MNTAKHGYEATGRLRLDQQPLFRAHSRLGATEGRRS